jgi:hypothetical protein
LIACTLVIALVSKIHAQELVPNSDFESHKPFCTDCSYHPPGISFEYLNDWTQSGTGWILYCNTVHDKPFLNGYVCCYPPVEPHSGVGMTRLWYGEACPVKGDTGCASYLHATLDSVMRIGEVYEVSAWVYFPRNDMAEQSILGNFGIYLSRRREYVASHDLIETPYFFGTQIIPDQWVRIHYCVRALCEMRHLTIGPYKTEDWPNKHRLIDNSVYFFVDDVSVK